VYPDFSPVETYLNPQRSSRRPPSWIFIRNILFILPLGAEWMEWRSVHSGIGMRNRKTRVFYTFWPFSFQNCELKNAPLDILLIAVPCFNIKIPLFVKKMIQNEVHCINELCNVGLSGKLYFL